MLRNTRRTLALGFLLAFALTSPPSAQSQKETEGTPPQPKIFIGEMRYDLGEVYEQDKYTHKFKIENKGKADLVIEKVKPG